MIEDIGREPEGAEQGVRAIAVDVPVARWARHQVVFAIALGLISFHLVETRADVGGWPSFGRLLDAAVGVGLVAGATRMYRHGGRAVRASLALLIATPAVSLGLGTTGAHIWKLGPRGIDVTGVAAIGAGLVLLGLATATLLAEVRGWRRLLAGPVALVAVYYVFAPLMIAAFLTHVPPTILGGRTPADEGLPYRDVTLTTADGVDLSAWYVPSRNGAAVVVLHGSSSSRLNVLEHVGVIGRAGYGVVAFDARGHGHSGGVAMDLGWDEHTDIRAAVSFLSRQREVEPGRIAALGISMGATGALNAAAEDPRIGAVVSDGAAIATFDDALTLGSTWTFPFYWTLMAAADLMSSAEPPLGLEDAMRRIGDRPVLLIAGRGKGEQILNDRYRAAGSSRTELLQLPDVKHSLGIWRRPVLWRERVLGFLERSLLR